MSAYDTIYPADTVEFCPHPNALNIFACGTYKLETSSDADSGPQKRRGQVLLFQVDCTSDQGFQHIQTLDFAAVPDVKWCHMSQSARAILGVADSEGGVNLHVWDEENQVLDKLDSIQCAPSNILCLSLDWSSRKTPGTDVGSLIVSLSDGSICLLRSDDERGISLIKSWPAHDYESWVAAWNYWDTNIVYSGGDDLKMKGWDIRQSPHAPIFVNKRFDAGVTSIQSHPNIEHLVAVGSYNDTVMLFDMRKPLIPLSDVNVGGGAWRVKWHPSPTRKTDLLVACMHDGFKVVRFDQSEGANNKGEIIKRFDSHSSLAYGADWSFDSPDNDKTLIGSCSFYDHALHLWNA